MDGHQKALALLRARRDDLPGELFAEGGLYKNVLAGDQLDILDALYRLFKSFVEYRTSDDGWQTDESLPPSCWEPDDRVRIRPDLAKEARASGLVETKAKNPALNDGPASPGQKQKQEHKENRMAIKIQVKTFVNSEDIAGLSNGAVLELISGEEGAIARLEKLEAKPACIVKEIAKRKAGIADLVAALDARKVDPADAE